MFFSITLDEFTAKKIGDYTNACLGKFQQECTKYFHCIFCTKKHK